MAARSLQSSNTGRSSTRAVSDAIDLKTLPEDRRERGTNKHDIQSRMQRFSSRDSASDPTGEEASGYEDEDQSAVSSPSTSPEDEGSDVSNDSGPVRKKRRKSQTSKDTIYKKGAELWREGVKTGLGPGKQIIIAKPKARPAGKIPYANNYIHPNTILFLQDLAKNNDREWLKMNDPDYRAALKDFNTFIETLQQRVIELDETIPDLPSKDVIFRIYRDVRFSPDKTPYKTHFSAAWSRTGRKGPFAAYYVQIKPDASYVGGGLWMPEARHLAAIRANIDANPQRITRILSNSGIRKDFLGNVGQDGTKVVKAFASHNAESALKTKPKGYHASHQQIELLRLRSFTLGRKFAVHPGLDELTQALAQLVPFITYLNNVVMPDENPSSEHSSGHEQEDGSESESNHSGN